MGHDSKCDELSLQNLTRSGDAERAVQSSQACTSDESEERVLPPEQVGRIRKTTEVAIEYDSRKVH